MNIVYEYEYSIRIKYEYISSATTVYFMEKLLLRGWDRGELLRNLRRVGNI